MQLLYPERGKGGELRLLASRGFTPEAARFWEWVGADSGCSCGEALRTGRRVVVPDIEHCEFVADTADRAAYLQAGIFAVQSTPLISRTGKLLGMISTHWRKTHEPSERALRLLDILARQAADLLERMRAEEALRDADRRKDEFLAMLSHELRNPLAPIISATRVLQLEEASGNQNLVQRQAREIIERQVGQLTRLVNDLLEVSRVITGRVRLQIQDVELKSVIESALETTRPLLERQGIRVMTDLGAGSVQLRADSVRLQQVFVNLLNNAAKYTDEGGVVAVSVNRSGDSLVVRIRDNGVGISQDLLPRIFDLFSQAEQTMDRSQGGLGIGLSLVKHLVALHGGQVEARSDGLGLGSEFRVELPIGAPPSVAAVNAAPPEVPIDKPSCRILVVDDNVDSCTMLTALLRHAGHSVREAHDGREALRSALKWRPDIVLLDIGLPYLSGYEVAQQLRQQSYAAEMRLVALTGYGQDEDVRAAEEAGFDAHFTKPLDFEAFLERISAWKGD
jgi:signal transduction histidine kinase/CheY-like chemotaxis protein